MVAYFFFVTRPLKNTNYAKTHYLTYFLLSIGY